MKRMVWIGIMAAVWVSGAWGHPTVASGVEGAEIVEWAPHLQLEG